MSNLYSLISSPCIWLSNVTFLWSLERSNIIEEMSNYLTLFFNIKELNINQVCASQLSQLKLSQNQVHTERGSFNAWIHYQLLHRIPISIMLVTQKVNTDPESTLDCLPVNTKCCKWRSAHRSWRLLGGCPQPGSTSGLPANGRIL